MPILNRTAGMECMNNRGDYAGGCGSRHTDKELRAARSHALNVETSQPPGTTDEECKTAEPAEATQLVEGFGRQVRHAANAPGKSQYGRRNTEAYYVGERVELHSKLGVGAGHAGDAAVERIKNNGDADGLGSMVEIISGAQQ